MVSGNLLRPLQWVKTVLLDFGLKRNKKFHLETYGKLPFYNDYISIITSSEATAWKNWLLNTFGTDGRNIPKGNWPFIFQFSKSSNLIVGLIEESSDGIRNFPFSLFSVYKAVRSSKPYNCESFIDLWKTLIEIRNHLASVPSIEDCYNLLRGKIITLPANKNIAGSKGDEQQTVIFDNTVERPFLTVFKPDGKNNFQMLMTADTSPTGLIENWRHLAN